MSSEEANSKNIPTIMLRMRVVRGVLLWYATFVIYLILIVFRFQDYLHDISIFSPIASLALSMSFVIGTYEIYFGAKYLRKPTSDILSGESIIVLVLSLFTETLIVIVLWISPYIIHSSIPVFFLALAFIHLATYMSLFLIEIRILYSEYSTRPKKIPSFNDAYIPERFR